MTSGLSSLAQAVLDHTGHPTAAIAVTYVAAEVDKRTEASLISAVTSGAAQMSRGRLPGSVQAAGRLERQRLHRPLRIRARCRHAGL